MSAVLLRQLSARIWMHLQPFTDVLPFTVRESLWVSRHVLQTLTKEKGAPSLAAVHGAISTLRTQFWFTEPRNIQHINTCSVFPSVPCAVHSWFTLPVPQKQIIICVYKYKTALLKGIVWLVWKHAYLFSCRMWDEMIDTVPIDCVVKTKASHQLVSLA